MHKDLTEWSLPWHELQRSLAAGVGAHGAAGWQSRAVRIDVRCVPAAASSWLVRARTRVLPVRRAGAK